MSAIICSRAIFPAVNTSGAPGWSTCTWATSWWIFTKRTAISQLEFHRVSIFWISFNVSLPALCWAFVSSDWHLTCCLKYVTIFEASSKYCLISGDCLMESCTVRLMIWHTQWKYRKPSFSMATFMFDAPSAVALTIELELILYNPNISFVCCLMSSPECAYKKVMFQTYNLLLLCFKLLTGNSNAPSVILTSFLLELHQNLVVITKNDFPHRGNVTPSNVMQRSFATFMDVLIMPERPTKSSSLRFRIWKNIKLVKFRSTGGLVL